MARRNGQGPRQLQDVSVKFHKGEQRLLKVLEEEGLISNREREGLVRQITQAASHKRASELLSAAHSIHNKVVQVVRRNKMSGDARDRMELETLFEITQLTQGGQDRGLLLDSLLELVQKVVPFENATLFLVHSETEKLSIAAQKGEVVDLIGGVKFDLGFGFSSWVAKQQKPILLPELNKGRRSTGVAVGSFLSVPLIVQSELIGVLNMSHAKTKSFSEDHLRMAVLASGQAAAVIQRLLMNEEMSLLAITDDLTGLWNRRHFAERLRHEIDRARRHDEPFSVAMIDFDGFKEINDQHGHQLGDRVLADMGRLLQKCGRSSDLTARYGGDEFVILMPKTDEAQALLAGERLRMAISDHTFPRRKKLTVSVGLATYPIDGAGAQELLRKADRALYAAKREGRNRALAVRAIAKAVA